MVRYVDREVVREVPVEKEVEKRVVEVVEKQVEVPKEIIKASQLSCVFIAWCADALACGPSVCRQRSGEAC